MRVEAGPPYSGAFLRDLETDERSGARALLAICHRMELRAKASKDRMEAMFRYEHEAKATGFRRVGGVDEAGRGPLAGPIVAGAVVLNEPIAGLNDSKLLKESERESLYERIMNDGHAVGVAVIEPEDIDRLGIQTANYRAMTLAATSLEPLPDFLLIDGFAVPGCPIPHRRIVKGDRLSQSIAAASIIAKVTRDRIMLQVDTEFPEYGFARHKGYATEEHLAAIERHGPCPVHRKSFAPFTSAAQTGSLFEESNMAS
ncbi:MAG: ribonuclease HII [Candidatus Hydrogenedentes bacterium]|nr:ribonuclease HII [Candidatus Hydrogenedentota bacterium]